MAKTAELECRRIATKTTLATMRGNVASFEGESCLHFAHAHLIALGHDLPEIPAFNSARGAAKAMKTRGWASVEDMLDQYLDRIEPAQMLLGDIATTEGEGGLASILICAGPHKLMGWLPERQGFALFDGGLDEVTGAWRGWCS